MNRRGLSLAVLVCAVLVGCGGTEVASEGEELGSVAGALVTCTATCQYGPSVSCTGSTCSAVNDSHVDCDGLTTACPPPPSACTTLVSCENLNGRACSVPRAERECCSANSTPGDCTCVMGKWLCIY